MFFEALKWQGIWFKYTMKTLFNQLRTKSPHLALNNPIFVRILKGTIVILLAVQLIINSFSISKWFRGIIHTINTYAFLLPQERIYSCPIEEYRFICFVNKNIPLDANILWVVPASISSAYHIYPRKIFQQKKYAPDEEVVVEKEFLRSRNIDYVLFDYDAFYPIGRVKIKDFPGDPSRVILEKE